MAAPTTPLEPMVASETWTNFLSEVYPNSPDIILLSSDDIPHPAHRQRIEVHSRILEIAVLGGISSPAWIVEDQLERRQLEEPGDILELLLRFMYPHAQPTLKDEPFARVVALTKAVEKCGICAAMVICEEALSVALDEPGGSDRAATALGYGVRNGILELIDKAAPLTLTVALEDMAECLSITALKGWLAYRGRWDKVLLHAATSPVTLHEASSRGYRHGAAPSCPEEIHRHIWRHIQASGLFDLEKLPSQESLPYCSCGRCHSSFQIWKEDIATQAGNIPQLSQLITTSQQFQEDMCFSDWDLTLVSADGVTFNVHRKNLSVHSTIFADADGISTLSAEPEVVALTETADVLGLLLKFMYRRPPPILNNVGFATIADLAKAVEKYEVVAATYTVEKHLKRAQAQVTDPQMALQMLAYGVKYNDMEMINLAAKHTIKIPPNEVFQALASEGPEQFLKWINFRDALTKYQPQDYNHYTVQHWFGNKLIN